MIRPRLGELFLSVSAPELAGRVRARAASDPGYRLTKRLLVVPPWVWIVLAWGIASLPNLSIRELQWEEGTNAGLARDVLARGDLLEPEIFGLRFAEKPSLLPWLIAAAARLTGTVDEWSARLPPMLAVLGTALLVHRLARRYASAPAALFAAAAFMFSPLVLRKLTISEPDTLITFLSFAAFVVWWDGEARGRVTAGRWLACGGLLAVLTMAKGPQPVAFFALGVGGYLVVRRRWAALPGLALCLGLPVVATVAWAATVYREGDLPMWLTYMRVPNRIGLRHYLRERIRLGGLLPIDLLPGTMLLPAVLVARWRRSAIGAAARPILLPLALYAGLCTLVLLGWPGTKSRYAMPAAPAIAVMAGIAIDPLWRRRHWAAAAALATVVVLFLGQVALVVAVRPFYADYYSKKRNFAAAINATVRASPAPLFVLGRPLLNKLFYVTWPIRTVMDADALPAPAWALTWRAQLGRIEAARPDLVIHVSGALPDPRLVLARIERRRDVDENRTGAETVSESPVRSPAVPLPPPSSRP
jgi:4-amino-4-deoxy-L-arabinose transferase-like glycosyltransferase